ncbi:nicotinamide N-methyltransferase-like [Mytilus edulis]|uniref:nicotinamide N-methyltransferase-like n=1 Tax=Mytilus edulis TaxID=6550 RepID=UPI0039F136E2
MSTLTSTDYSNDFDVNWYINSYYSAVSGCHEEGDFLTFVLMALHDIFKAGNVHGKTLLDIGTGPTIHTVISACPYVQNIILSDYSQVNRDALGDWKEDKLQTGSALCQFVLDIEGGKIHKTVPERFEEIRQKIREILPVDVNKWPPIQLGNDCPDIIVSSLCFEAACLEVQDYKKIVQNVGRLMTPGCHLVVIGVLDQTFYRVGNFRFSCLKISESDLKAVYATNGFDIKSWKEYIPPPRNAEEAEFSDFQKAFVMHAVKVK